jgi:monoamine oxidase
LTETEWQFAGRMTGMLWEESASALEAFIEEMGILGGDERWRLRDGMESLPQALEADLVGRPGVRVWKNTRVTRVEVVSGGQGARVFSETGEISTAAGAPFDYVVCAVPASATARVAFAPPLDVMKMEAVSSLEYQRAAKSLVHLRQRRWEIPGLTNNRPIFGGASYTDSLIQQCWYPSDNVRAIWHRPAEGAKPVLYEVARGGVTMNGRHPLFASIEYVEGHPQGSQSPAILTGAYMTGVNADRFTSLSRSEQDRVVIDGLAELHPGIAADIVEMQHWAWIEQQTPGGGAWTYFLPATMRATRIRCAPPIQTPQSHESSSLANTCVSFMGGCRAPSSRHSRRS